MHIGLSKRQWISSGIVALCVGGIYVLYYIHAIGSAWQRKEGDIAPISDWLQSVSLFVAGFPFGFFTSILLTPLLNGLFWSVAAGLCSILWFRRKNTVSCRS